LKERLNLIENRLGGMGGGGEEELVEREEEVV